MKLEFPAELVVIRSELLVVLPDPSPKAALLVTEYSVVDDAAALTPMEVEVPTAKR